MAKNPYKPRTVYLHPETYRTQAQYIIDLAKERGITSASNMLAIIISEHKTLTNFQEKK